MMQRKAAVLQGERLEELAISSKIGTLCFEKTRTGTYSSLTCAEKNEPPSFSVSQIDRLMAVIIWRALMKTQKGCRQLSGFVGIYQYFLISAFSSLQLMPSKRSGFKRHVEIHDDAFDV